MAYSHPVGVIKDARCEECGSAFYSGTGNKMCRGCRKLVALERLADAMKSRAVTAELDGIRETVT